MVADSHFGRKIPVKKSRFGSASRRNFLKLAFCTLPVIHFWKPVELSANGMSLELPLMLHDLLNVLIPGDVTPGATELGVDKKIMDKLKRYKYYKVLVEKGCLWFEQQSKHEYKMSFSGLPVPDKIKLMHRAEKSGLRNLEYNFFRTLRQDAFVFYYSDPRSWTGLVYAGPPQPHGFPDFHKKPIAHSYDNT